MLQGHQPPHTQELAQAIRAVAKHIPPSSVPPAHRDEIFYVECHADPETNKDVVLWEDILQAFETAVQVRWKNKIIPFLKGKDFSTYGHRSTLEVLSRYIAAHQEKYDILTNAILITTTKTTI
jgi:hypothetical protein